MRAFLWLGACIAGLMLTAGVASAQPVWNTLPGEFAFKTPKGFYVGALSGGGLVAQPTVVTGATSAADWEKFRIAVMDPPPPNDKAILTHTGDYRVAKAAFDKAVRERPGRLITLRQKARLIADSRRSQ